MTHPMDALGTLGEALEEELASIEIIPGDWSDWVSPTMAPGPGPGPSSSLPYLLVDGNLGVPLKVAYRLYPEASRFPRLKELSPLDEKGVTSILRKTAIILIVNPAHQAALNTRKYLIAQGRRAADRELRYSELLLRGVKACAKESALWAHRRWCLHSTYGSIHDHTDIANTPPSLAQSPLIPFLPAEAIPREFALVRHAVTLYPRSYHAWTHWRYAFDLPCALAASTSILNEQRQVYSKVLLQEFKELRKWVGTHTTDASAIHHLVTSLPSVWSLTSSSSLGRDVCEAIRVESSPSELAREAWHLLTAFQPHRETGWIYLRSLLDHLPAEERRVYRERMSSLDVPWTLDWRQTIVSCPN